MSLANLARAVEAAKHRAKIRPLEFAKFTPPQIAWLSNPERFRILRGGNQVGKTFAQASEVIWRCMGEHRYREVPPAPVECWIVTHSWEQSLSVQKKVWELLPKDMLADDTIYQVGRGFRGKVPIIRFKNGSIIRIKTTGQGVIALASSTISYVGVDEPPPRAIWGELTARVLRSGPLGGIGLTLTPVGRSCGWLESLAESGGIADHVAPLTVENVTPEGGQPMLTAEQIEDIAGRYLSIDRDQRLNGAWSGSVEDRVFTAFDDGLITTDRPRSGWKWEIGIGIDHGSDAGSQVATLCAVFKGHKDGRPRIHILDEYTSGGEAVAAALHARGILGMLRRNGMTHNSVDRWVGDRAYGGRRAGGKMSNQKLTRALEVELGLPRGHLPFGIKTAWKPRGSIYEGCSIIHETCIRKNFLVHPRCKQLIKSLKEFRFKDDESKHSIDSLRYGSVELITKRLYQPHKLKMY